MPKADDAEKLALLRRLRDLAPDPPAQRVFALDLLEPGVGPALAGPALRVLDSTTDPAARPVLLRLYAHYAADGVRRDPGTSLRVALLRALRPLLGYPDLPLLETAVATYEFLPPTRAEAAHELRALALLLHDLDPARALWDAVRLLADPHTSFMSGEPGVTAARLLGAEEQWLPLYYYVVHQQPGVSEVRSECLRRLARLPVALLPAVLAQYADSEDEIVLAGLYDLLLTHPTHAEHYPRLLAFLRATHFYDVYRYLVASIVADHKADLLPPLLDIAAAERDPRKVEILRAALDLIGSDPDVQPVILALEKRSAPAKSRATTPRRN
jgi:hypothetical protein